MVVVLLTTLTLPHNHGEILGKTHTIVGFLPQQRWHIISPGTWGCVTIMSGHWRSSISSMDFLPVPWEMYVV